MEQAGAGKAPESDPRQDGLINIQSLSDSGYGSLLEVDASFVAFTEMSIPTHLQNRFRDLKRLFTHPLLNLIGKKRAPTRDISIKLRWMGPDEDSARLYILIQCDDKAVNPIKEFFAETQVKEQVGNDFQVRVIPGLQRLADQILEVSADDSERQTLCGQGITIENSAARMAIEVTMGGVVAVKKAGE
ncbi:hypothetical protein F5Y14DRAFT_45175 [Nemania sp. NC0429]|nr:hypothetical protein F5Y14DRAFT_45175 [Nemania sp. NC0429]